MTTITINDLVDSKELDQSAMAATIGGRFRFPRPRYHRGHWHYRTKIVRHGNHYHRIRVKSWYHRGHWHF